MAHGQPPAIPRRSWGPPPPKPPRFDGYHLSMRIASQPIGRCSACDALIYLRFDDDNAMLGLEHQPGNIDCRNWDQLGELRLAKVLP